MHYLTKFFLIVVITSLTASISFGQQPTAGSGSITYNKTTMDPNSTPLRSFITDSLLFVVTQSAGVFAYDITNFNNPVELNNNLDVGLPNAGISYNNGYLYVADGLMGVLIYDVKDAKNISLLTDYKTTGDARDVLVKNGYLYVAESANGFSVHKINPDGTLTLDNEYSQVVKWGYAWRLRTSGDSLLVVDGGEGIKIFNASNPTSISYLSSIKTNGQPYDVLVDNNKILVADGAYGLVEYEMSRTGRAKDIDRIEVQGDAQFIIKSGKYYFLAAGVDGIYVLTRNSLGKLRSEFKTSEKGEIISFSKKNEELYVASNTGLMLYEFNSPPFLMPTQQQVVNENVELRFTRIGKDPDGAPVTISATGLPDGAIWSEDSVYFKWTPTYEQSGEYSVYYTIRENTPDRLFDLDTVNIIVNHVNRPPTIAKIDSQYVEENKTILFTAISGEDPDIEDEGKLVHFARNLPSGATFDPQTLVFDWTPGYEQSGEYIVTIGVSDPAGLEAISEFKVVVDHVSRPPAIAAIPLQSVDENKTLSFKISWNDPDAEDKDSLRVSKTTLPAGATFDSLSGQFVWTPNFEQSGQYNITFTVEDGNVDGRGKLTDQKTVNITVNHVSRLPFIAGVENKTVKEDSVLTFNITVSDPDREDEGLLVISGNNLPEGSTLVDSVFSWKPTYFQAGDYNFGFNVTDGTGLKSSIQLTTKVVNVNRPPVIQPFASFVLNENEAFTYTFDISDPDLEDLVKTLSPLPEGATWDAASSTFKWTPSFEQAGPYSMKLTVNDPLDGVDTATVKVTVNNVNRFPVFAATPDQTVNENTELTFSVSATDPDLQWVTITASDLPAGSSFDTTSRSFNWTPTFEDAGTYSLKLVGTDIEKAQTPYSVSITVINVNRLPILDTLIAQVVDENSLLSLKVTATDPDGQTVNYLSTNLPNGAMLNASSGSLSWTPTFDQAGDYTITVVASDPEGGSDSQTFSVKVNNVNRAPVVTDKSFKFSENNAGSFNLEASDPDGQAVTVSFEPDFPDGLSYNAQTQTLSWTPTYEQAGNYGPYTITVKDPEEASATASMSIVVANTNRAPGITAVATQTVDVGSNVSLTLSGQDPDGDELTYRISNLPSGASLDAKSGQFSWTPSAAGTFSLNASVSDGTDSATTTIQITVTGSTPNN